jgi:hypothetical protein
MTYPERPTFQGSGYLDLWWRRLTGGTTLICATGGGHFIRRLQAALIEAGYADKLTSVSPDVVVERSRIARDLGLGEDSTRRTLRVDGAWGPITQFALYWAAKDNGAAPEVLSAIRTDFARRSISPVSMRYAAIIAYHPGARFEDVEFSLMTVPPGWSQVIAVPSYDAALRCWDPNTSAPPDDPRGGMRNARSGSSSITRTSSSSSSVMSSYGDSHATGILGFVERHPIATAVGVASAVGLGVWALSNEKQTRRKGRR